MDTSIMKTINNNADYWSARHEKAKRTHKASAYRKACRLKEREKKVAIVLSALVVFYLLLFSNWWLGYYKANATVVALTDDTVIVETDTGDIFSYYGNAKIGEKVVLSLHDNGTDDSVDDAVIKVKKGE